MFEKLAVAILLVIPASCVNKTRMGIGHIYRPAEIPADHYTPGEFLDIETVNMTTNFLCPIICSQTPWCSTYRFIEPSSCEMSTFYVTPFYQADGVQDTVKLMTGHMLDHGDSIVAVHEKSENATNHSGHLMLSPIFPRPEGAYFLSMLGNVLNFELNLAKFVSYIGVSRPGEEIIQLYTGIDLPGRNPFDFSFLDLAGPPCTTVFCEVRYDPPRWVRLIGIRCDVNNTKLHRIIIA